MKGGIAETLSNSHRVLEMTSKLLTGYFAKIPEAQLNALRRQLSDRILDTFKAFDSNNNGSLEPLTFTISGCDFSPPGPSCSRVNMVFSPRPAPSSLRNQRRAR
eukprot:323436-Rhodomonas_salina.1